MSTTKDAVSWECQKLLALSEEIRFLISQAGKDTTMGLSNTRAKLESAAKQCKTLNLGIYKLVCSDAIKTRMYSKANPPPKKR